MTTGNAQCALPNSSIQAVVVESGLISFFGTVLRVRATAVQRE